MKKLSLQIIVVLLLFLIGTVLSFAFYREVYYTAIQVYHPGVLNPDFFKKPLLKDRVLRGEIVASYNNFGTVKIRMNTYGRFNYDSIHFRLREKGTEPWVITNSYITDRFPDKLLYGFGFPPFEYSKGKTFEFEFSSDAGTNDNAIGFLPGHFSVASQYVFSKNLLLKNTDDLFQFLSAKIQSLYSDPYFVLYYIIFLLPGVIYLLILFYKNTPLLYVFELLSFIYMLVVYIFIPIAINWDTMLYIITIGILLFELQTYSISQAVHHVSDKRYIASRVYHLPMILIVVMMCNIALGDDLVASRTAIGIFYLTILSLIISYRELLKK